MIKIISPYQSTLNRQKVGDIVGTRIIASLLVASLPGGDYMYHLLVIVITLLEIIMITFTWSTLLNTILF